MKLTNLRCTDPDNICIDMMVQIDDHPVFDEPQPFHYVPHDDAPVTELIREELARRKYKIASYVPPKPPEPLNTGKSGVIAD